MRAFVFILLISGINTFAQQADSLKELPFNPGFHRNYNPVLAHFNGEEDFQINVISDAGAGSNHLPASFINNLLFGGMIDEDQKDKAAEKLADENNAGFDFYNAVWFNTPLGDSSPYRLHLGVEYMNHRSIAYSPDLYTIGFYGNAGFAEQTADLSDGRYDGNVWMSYKVGMSRQFGGFTLAATASFVQGLWGQEMDVPQASVYTAPDGSYLDLDYDITFQSAGTGVVRWGKTHGTGWSGDVHLGWHSKDNKWSALVTAADFGTIAWNVEAFQYYADTSIRFEGIDVTNVILSGNNAAVGDEDLLFDYLFADSTNTSFTTNIPMRMEGNLTHQMDNGWMFTLGAMRRVHTSHRPLGYLRVGKPLGESTFASAILSAGGYGGYGVGLDIRQQFGHFISLHAGSSSLLGFAAPDAFSTVSAYAALRVAFNR